MGKIKLQQIVWNLLGKLPKLYTPLLHSEWRSHLEIFSLPQVTENFKQYLLPISEQIFYRKQSLDALHQNCEKQQ